MGLVQLEAKKRTETGKGPAKKLRRNGLIPSVVYGQEESLNIVVDHHTFLNLSHHITKATVINLDVEGKSYEVLIKDYTKDYVKDQFVHIDFYELKKGKPAHFRIPFRFVGSPVGVKEGGVFVTQLVEVELECLPKDIVSDFEVQIGQMNVGDTIHVRDIEFDEKYKILSHADDVIAHIAGKTGGEDTEAESTEE